MKQRARKFIGVWLVLGLLIAYPIAATLLFTELLGGFSGALPNWATLVYFMVAGLAWAVPAGIVIKWMAKPNAGS